LEGILKDSTYKFADDVTTPQVENLQTQVTAALNKATILLKKAELENKLEWHKYKATHIDHLAKQPALSRSNLTIGGGRHIINATRENHGPSWRMVVELTAKTNAYGIYPGGQSGNPGSKYYDNFVDQWAAGKYYSLWMMTKGEEIDKRIKGVIRFGKS
jgi:penicillin G amidase